MMMMMMMIMIIIIVLSPRAQMMMMMMLMSLNCKEHADHTFSKKVCFSFSLVRFILQV